MKRILSIATVVSLIAGLAPIAQAATPTTINFDYCTSSKSTNCIESLSIITEDNFEHVGDHIAGTSAEFNFGNLTFASGDGRARIGMSWRPDGAPLCWWGSCDYHSGSIDMGIGTTSSLARQDAGIIKFSGDDQRQCGTRDNPTLCGKGFNFGGNYKFQFKFRALGFNLGMISGKARDVLFNDLNINSGNDVSHTYEVTATNITWDTYIINDIRNSQPRDRERADYFSDGLILWFWDVNNTATTRLPSRCSAAKISGPPTQLLFNTFNMGSPYWNPSDSTLSVQLESSHLAYDGIPNKGFYEMVFSKATSECLWGINPEKSARAEVKISYSDGGVADIATVNQSYRNGSLKISASNFHLSTPTISTKLTASATPIVVATPNPTPSPTTNQSVVSLKKTTITCVKGKLTKKVSAGKPKCPAGYKKK